jgi:hypothetical protein
MPFESKKSTPGSQGESKKKPRNVNETPENTVAVKVEDPTAVILGPSCPTVSDDFSKNFKMFALFGFVTTYSTALTYVNWELATEKIDGTVSPFIETMRGDSSVCLNFPMAFVFAHNFIASMPELKSRFFSSRTIYIETILSSATLLAAYKLAEDAVSHLGEDLIVALTSCFMFYTLTTRFMSTGDLSKKIQKTINYIFCFNDKQRKIHNNKNSLEASLETLPASELEQYSESLTGENLQDLENTNEKAPNTLLKEIIQKTQTTRCRVDNWSRVGRVYGAGCLLYTLLPILHTWMAKSEQGINSLLGRAQNETSYQSWVSAGAGFASMTNNALYINNTLESFPSRINFLLLCWTQVLSSSAYPKVKMAATLLLMAGFEWFAFYSGASLGNEASELPATFISNFMYSVLGYSENDLPGIMNFVTGINVNAPSFYGFMSLMLKLAKKQHYDGDVKKVMDFLEPEFKRLIKEAGESASKSLLNEDYDSNQNYRSLSSSDESKDKKDERNPSDDEKKASELVDTVMKEFEEESRKKTCCCFGK